MFSWFKKEDWALVKTFRIFCSGVYYIHCFEAKSGKRKIECILNGKSYSIKKEDNCGITTELYQERIYRWLKGRRDPEIPTYGQIGEDDTANLLKEKIG
jgi:hypothetical protein